MEHTTWWELNFVNSFKCVGRFYTKTIKFSWCFKFLLFLLLIFATLVNFFYFKSPHSLMRWRFWSTHPPLSHHPSQLFSLYHLLNSIIVYFLFWTVSSLPPRHPWSNPSSPFSRLPLIFSIFRLKKNIINFNFASAINFSCFFSFLIFVFFFLLLLANPLKNEVFLK